jgi:hypothetical protein
MAWIHRFGALVWNDHIAGLGDCGHAVGVISGLLTPIGKTSREALISKEPTKFVVKYA